MTRRALAGLLAVAAVLGVVIGVAGVHAAVFGPPPAPVLQRWQLDGIYLAKARERGLRAGESELLLTAQAVCDTAGHGRSLAETAELVGQRLRLDYPDAVFVVALAVKTRCPEYGDAVGE